MEMMQAKIPRPRSDSSLLRPSAREAPGVRRSPRARPSHNSAESRQPRADRLAHCPSVLPASWTSSVIKRAVLPHRDRRPFPESRPRSTPRQPSQKRHSPWLDLSAPARLRVRSAAMTSPTVTLRSWGAVMAGGAASGGLAARRGPQRLCTAEFCRTCSISASCFARRIVPHRQAL